MKSGIELIADERREQIIKHGRSVARDLEANSEYNQLVKAAIALLKNPSFEDRPVKWSSKIWDKMRHKNKYERLIIAGALIAAEIDRLNLKTYNSLPEKCLSKEDGVCSLPIATCRQCI